MKNKPVPSWKVHFIYNNVMGYSALQFNDTTTVKPYLNGLHWKQGVTKILLNQDTTDQMIGI